jgi:hypothetical protein
MNKIALALTCCLLFSCGEKKTNNQNSVNQGSGGSSTGSTITMEKPADDKTDARESTPAETVSRQYLAFKKEVNQKIDENKKEIERLKEKIAGKKEGVDAYYFDRVKRVEKKNADLSRRLDRFNEKASVKWEEFKRDITHDMDDLRSSIDDLFQEDKK